MQIQSTVSERSNSSRIHTMRGADANVGTDPALEYHSDYEGCRRRDADTKLVSDAIGTTDCDADMAGSLKPDIASRKTASRICVYAKWERCKPSSGERSIIN